MTDRVDWRATAPSTETSKKAPTPAVPALAYLARGPVSAGLAAGSFADRCGRFARERRLRGQMGRLASCTPRWALGATLRGAVLLGCRPGQRWPATGTKPGTCHRRGGVEHQSSASQPNEHGGDAAASTTTSAPPGLPSPSPVPLVVHPALAGEGNWQPTGPLVQGRPAMYWLSSGRKTSIRAR